MMPEKQSTVDQVPAVETQKPALGENQGQPVVHPLVEATNQMTNKKVLLLIPVLIIILGIGSGYALANMRSGEGGLLTTASKQVLNKASQATGKQVAEAGWDDSKLFPDEAKGLLEKNDGSVVQEGSHRLIREGGPSQTVYLTSSVVDLSKFEGKQVQVKGETFTAQKAGWLMDVGYVKMMD